ncbi:MAG: DUF3794 domain-containing protein [Ruminococcaceae bacterium]|nr:DUF3794 domain-containing protein [Oscillospiraceae bacterium]
MNFNLMKREIALKEIINTKYGQTKAECDLIVPDTKPDVARILQVCAKPVITQKTPQTDKVYVQGVVHLTVVYIPEGGGIKSIFSKLDFSYMADCAGVESSSHVFAEAELEEVDYQTLNSRKINIKCCIGIDIKVSRKISCAIPTGFEENDEIMAKYKDYCISCVSAEEEQSFRFREKIEIPAGKPDICEIIKINAKCMTESVRYSDGKISVSGDIDLFVVYSDENGCVVTTDEVLPFNETFEGINLPEGEIDSNFSVCDIVFDVYEEPDGTRRCLNIDLLICGTFRVSEIAEICGIDDAFSTVSPVKISKTNYSTESITDKNTTQIAHKDTVLIPDYLPSVFKVSDCSGEARITGISIENGRITVEGEILSNILYSSEDESSPLSGMSHISSFCQTVDSSCVTEDSICEAKVSLDHIGYNISGDKEIELRFIVSLTISLLKSETIEIIEDITEDSETEMKPCSPAVIYFAEEGESVWNIAKRYFVTPESIMAANNLESEHMKKGQKICIFR